MRILLDAIKFICSVPGYFCGLIGDARFAAQLGLENGDGLPKRPAWDRARSETAERRDGPRIPRRYLFTSRGENYVIRATSYDNAETELVRKIGPDTEFRFRNVFAATDHGSLATDGSGRDAA